MNVDAPRVKSLPHQPTPFIGRAPDIAEATRLLHEERCRLLTLSGPGGIGKTRLAIEIGSQVADDYPHDVYFIPLAPLTAADNIVPAIASGIGCRFHTGDNLRQQLLNHLADQQLLLILDNFEHLLAGVDLIVDILNAANGVDLLVTSREVLNLQAEWVRSIKGMPVPENGTLESLESYSALALFAERARRVDGDFSLADERMSVIRICQLVEGMPLALELAASWSKVLSCAAIVERLESGLDFLATKLHDVEVRHRSIQAVFDQSWGLLNDEERTIFANLVVFHGGFSAEAAEYVAGASLTTLASLVDKSLIRVDATGRYDLHELLRQYAAECLKQKPEQDAAVHDQHCAFYTGLMNQPARNFMGTASTATLKLIDAEIDNVRAAWHWAVAHKRVSDLHQAMRGLCEYTGLRPWNDEGEQAFRQAVAALRATEPTEANQIALGLALACQTRVDIWLGRGPIPTELAQESVGILRPLNARPELAFAVDALGTTAHMKQDLVAAKPLYEEALALYEETGQYESQVSIVGSLAAFALILGDFEESEDRAQQTLALARWIGDQRTIAQVSFSASGKIAQIRGEYVKARRHWEEALVIARQHELVYEIIGALRRLGQLAEATGELETARDYLEESLTAARVLGRAWLMVETLTDLAHVLAAQGDYEAARQHYHEAGDITAIMTDQRLYASVQAGLGDVALRVEEYDEARHHYEEALVHYRATGYRPNLARYLATLGVIALAQGDSEQARQYLMEALAEGLELGAAPAILDSLIGIADWLLRQDKLVASRRLAALVANHPASHAQAKARADSLLANPAIAPVTTRQQDTPDALEPVARDVLRDLSAESDDPATQANRALPDPLTGRELDVLHLLAEGLTNAHIAERLFITVGTVKGYTHRIYSKLDVDNRLQAVAAAQRLNLL